ACAATGGKSARMFRDPAVLNANAVAAATAVGGRPPRCRPTIGYVLPLPIGHRPGLKITLWRLDSTHEQTMIQAFFALRYLLLLASIGATVGAVLMFWEGGADLVDALKSIGTPQNSKGVAANVMGATDAILFGIVLLVFAYAIAFGLVLDVSSETRE